MQFCMPQPASRILLSLKWYYCRSTRLQQWFHTVNDAEILFRELWFLLLMAKSIENSNTIELDIEGMDCPACALKIEKTVARINGVKDIKVDLGSETASIDFNNSNPDVSFIKDEIKKLGYNA